MGGVILDAYQLYGRLQKQDLLRGKPPMWWPNYGSFEVVVGAILTQNANWKRVELSLENLRSQKLLELENLCQIDTQELQRLISPSGLYRAKAEYIIQLARAIQASFSNFENFCAEVNRAWLLKQKGIGLESADSILCYACKKDAMVVDAYTKRLLSALEREFESYSALQAWCEEGLRVHFDAGELPKVFALFHGMIVEFVKAHSKNKKVNVESLK
ncbi:MAG: 3-methyladenine DNA glycosylase [Campylobacterales bacterium]|nr:3-methyladenine DNA glycosylase [Campylobacterales bacterium]